MSWTLSETDHKKVLKTFDDPIEAAEYCSDYEMMRRLIIENTTSVDPPWEEFSHIPDLRLKNPKYNWSLLLYGFDDKWIETSDADYEKDLINPELRHKMHCIINKREQTEYVPLEERLKQIPDDHEYPF